MIGFFVPVIGPALGATLGGMIGGALDPDRFKGPSLGDIPLQTSQEGVPCPIIFGTPPPFPGNVIQIGPVLYSTEDVEQDKGGPIIEEERVHQTYAIRICKGLATCLKAWRDGKLVYDVTGTGDIDAESAAAASRITFYTGSETQLPDPVLEALPPEHGGGAGEVNAHRGRAYMVVDRDNLTGTGGRIPQWTFLMASSATLGPAEFRPFFAVCTASVTVGGKYIGYSPDGLDWTAPVEDVEAVADGERIIYGGGRLLKYSGVGGGGNYSDDYGETWSANVASMTSEYRAMYLGGTFWFAAPAVGTFVGYSADGVSWTTLTAVVIPGLGSFGAGTSVGGEGGKVFVGSGNGWVTYTENGGSSWSTKVQPDPGNNEPITAVCTGEGQPVYVIGKNDGGALWWSDDGDVWNSASSPLSAFSGISVIHYDRTAGVYVAGTDDGEVAWSVNGTSWTLATTTGFGSVHDCISHAGLFVLVSGHATGRKIFTSYDGDNWTDQPHSFSAHTLESVAVMPCTGMQLPDAPGWYLEADGTICGMALPRATPGTVYLSEVELEIARLCGIPASKFDVLQITGIVVQGYIIGKQMTGADALRPLAMLHFHTLPEYDGQIHAKLLGGPSVVTLTDDDFVDAPEEDDEIRAQAIELPRKMNLYYADPSSEYATVIATAERSSRNVKASSLLAIEAPLTLDRDIAVQKPDILLKMIYEESQGQLKRELPAFKYSFLTDADPFHYNDKRWRILRMQTLETTIRIEAARDRISNLTSYATAGDVLAPTAQPRTLKGPTIFHAMNLPSLRTADNQPGIYVAGTGRLDGWMGYDLYISLDGGVTEQFVRRITDRATMGFLLEDITATQDDSNGPIPVRLYDGRTLESVTPVQLAARENAFVMTTAGVSEIAQVETVTETSGEDFDLTDVDRGLLGTTAAPHDADDWFVLLDRGVKFVPIDAAYAGQDIILRPVTIGSAAENNDTYTITFDPPIFVIDGGVVTP